MAVLDEEILALEMSYEAPSEVKSEDAALGTFSFTLPIAESRSDELPSEAHAMLR